MENVAMYGLEYICRDLYPNHVVNNRLYLLYMMVRANGI